MKLVKISDLMIPMVTVNIGYGMKLNDNISGGLVMRYLYSNLTGNQYVAGELTEPGNGLC